MVLMNKILIYFQTHNFLKNIAMIVSSSFVAQVIGIVFSLVVTRIYVPSEYGIMGVFVSTITILRIGSMLTYEKSIPIVQGDVQTCVMMRNCIKILLCFVFCLVVACMFLSEQCFDILNVAKIYHYRFLIPIGVLLAGVFAIFSQWAYRQRDYKLISVVNIYQAFVGGVIKVIGGLISPVAIWLILGSILSQFTGVSALFAKAKKQGFSLFDRTADSLYVLKQQYRFPLFMLPNDIINEIAVSGPVLILAFMYGTEVSGYYGLVTTVINVPLNLICSSISTVLYAEAAHLSSGNAVQIRNMCWKVTKTVGLGSIPGFAILYFWGPELFSLVFGSKWYAAGEYARVMIGYFWVYCMVLPCGRVLEIFSKQYVGLVLNILRLVLFVFAVYLMRVYSVTSHTAVFVICIVNMLIYGCGIICCFYILNNYAKVQQKSV